MSITTGFLTLQGTKLQGENPLPLFRDRNKNKSPGNDGTLQTEDLEYLGYESGFRILPYTMQDRYTRQKETIQLKSIVLENEHLRAEFLPEYGGRLYSLRDQKTKQELLFRNVVMQPANLAIRNAWFSGGIEWNIAQLGHTFSTNDDVFFARIEDEDHDEFLRMYDYERTRGLLWQIDFHLPKASKQLYAHVTIINDRSVSVPMYWWTNIAAKEETGCRVFSGTKEVLYIVPQSMIDGSDHAFGRATLPKLPSLPDVDASYPLNSNYTNEYFFQNPKTEAAPWEAITYTDGSGFFERSTQPLRIRKMFCWGNHSGGRHWLDYLSVPGKGDYLEIQAGLAPTQLHGMDMAPNSTISFTQAFGSLHLAPGDANYESYDVSHAIVRTAVNHVLPESDVLEKDARFHQLSILPCTQLLHLGHGFGTLENMRRSYEGSQLLPCQCFFPLETLREEQYDWLALLQHEELPELTALTFPSSWMTDLNFVPYLIQYLELHPTHLKTLLLLGVIYYENGHYDVAKEYWKQGLAITPLPIFYRNLAYASKQEDHIPEAIRLMEEADLFSYTGLDQAYFEEFFELLLTQSQWKRVYDYFYQLPEQLQHAERLIILTCEAAIELDQFEFLEEAFLREYALIREGETKLTEIWFQYADKKGIAKTELPPHLDLRML